MPSLTQTLLALALLSAPPDAGPPADAYAALSSTMQAAAIQWEILDPREVRYVLANPADFHADLTLLRRRRAELADAPPLSDCGRFPPRSVVHDWLHANRDLAAHLRARLEIELVHEQELSDAVGEVDVAYRAWDLMGDGLCGYYYATVRRVAMKKLRDEIGPAAYYSGQWPAPIPWHRMRRLN